MPTRAGWATLVLGGTGIALGRVFGFLELFLLGLIAIAMVIVSWAYVRLRRLQLEISRTITPNRVAAGSPARVELKLTNRANRPTPVLRIQDGVSGTRGARLSVAPMELGISSTAAYRLPTEKRGVVVVGPLEVEITDPFGIARSRIRSAPKAELLVHPPVLPVRRVPEPDGTDPNTGDDATSPVHQSGDEFHALRPYVEGDDVRRVHWASSARHDTLMVRQDEQPRHGRMAVMLDNRAAAMTTPALDIAATAAASLLVAAEAKHQLTRLITAEGVDTKFGQGTLHNDAIMRSLALANPVEKTSFRAQLESAIADAANTSIVIIGANFSDADTDAIARAKLSVRALSVLRVDDSAWSPGASASTMQRKVAMISITDERPFPLAWDHARVRRVGVGVGR